MRDAVRNKERWKGRRTPTQYPSTNYPCSPLQAAPRGDVSPRPSDDGEQLGRDMEGCDEHLFSLGKMSKEDKEQVPGSPLVVIRIIKVEAPEFVPGSPHAYPFVSHCRRRYLCQQGEPPLNVHVAASHNISFSGCTFQHLGGVCVFLLLLSSF